MRIVQGYADCLRDFNYNGNSKWQDFGVTMSSGGQNTVLNANMLYYDRHRLAYYDPAV